VVSWSSEGGEERADAWARRVSEMLRAKRERGELLIFSDGHVAVHIGGTLGYDMTSSFLPQWDAQYGLWDAKGEMRALFSVGFHGGDGLEWRVDDHRGMAYQQVSGYAQAMLDALKVSQVWA
jgi:hypothetical protein